MRAVGQSDYTSSYLTTWYWKKYELVSDFFYTFDETLFLDVLTNNSESVDVSGERKYDHNAIIANSQSSVLISGPILKTGETYEFNIELRTLYETSNWIFSLDNFTVEITS